MQLEPREQFVNEQFRVTDKELALLYEIGLNLIPTATDFVDYVSRKYQVSQSGVWYTLKKLKKERVLDFTEKGEEPHPLGLTEKGLHVLRGRITNVENRQYYRVQPLEV